MLCKNEVSLTLRPAQLLAHKLPKMLFVDTLFRLLLHTHGAIPGEQSPYPKANGIQQQWVLSAQSSLQTGDGNEGYQQEKYDRFHI